MAADALAPSSSADRYRARNPGPSWGLQFLRAADRLVPERLYRPIRAAGTAIALLGMPRQRRHSREYLRHVLPREPTLRDVFRHFFAFEEYLMLRLRVANGLWAPCDFGPEGRTFREWLESDEPVLLGTMHVGTSDMLGFQLGGFGNRSIHIVRQRVGNSHDTDALAAKMGPGVRFIWVNQGDELLFQLKEAAAAGGTIALQCDRLGFSARTEAFEFLGARRLFPFTIYHLSLIFGRPVILTVGVPAGTNRSRLIASPRFERAPGEAKEAALLRARAHFQAFLHELEVLLRQQPYLWFNFIPLNPPAPNQPAQ